MMKESEKKSSILSGLFKNPSDIIVMLLVVTTNQEEKI